MFRWNFGDILDSLAPVIPPNAAAYIHGDKIVRHGDAVRRSNNLARALIARGATPGAKVAFYMHNGPEYCELLAACFKARLVHVNINYRYTPDEVLYIVDNSDSEVLVYGPEFRDAVAAIRPRLTKVRTLVETGADARDAESFEALCELGDGATLDIARAPEDMFFIYTGGTTGMPKGVMWTHDDLRQITLAAARLLGPVPETLDELAAFTKNAGPAAASLVAPPQMHGTGLLTSVAAMLSGGAVITLTGRKFDPVEMAEAAHLHKPGSMTIVGDPFARPLLNILDAAPGRYDLSSVLRVTSSGVMWSLEVKRGLLRHMPKAVLADAFSSSEALGLGTSLMTTDGEIATARFALGARAKVFDEDGRPVTPGPEPQRGLVAVGPPNPIGYYKDPEKTARTFRMFDGVRYSVPGDWCIVQPDGGIVLLGRGNACINTGGEKVFPEEVEEALKSHPTVEDALTIGVPDPVWGQAVIGIVRLTPGAQLDEAALIATVRRSLAPYKAPKRVFLTNASLRAANGKADYGAAHKAAAEGLGAVDKSRH